MANAGIFKEAAGNHCGVHCYTPDLIVVYRGGVDDRVQLETEVVGEGP